ncbi:MAG: hypothetical protein QNK22_01990 [Xanthomonadales bacterium]|nr:hypothetical protein [Xanthomonadales bacterium]
MTTINSLYSPLAGAIGCDYSSSTNRLYFTEFGGKLSSLDLIRGRRRVVSHGITTLHGTWIFDFDTGAELGHAANAAGDVWWEQMTSVKRQMMPWGGAEIAYLGTVNFNSVSYADLQGVVYGTNPIIGNDDSTNLLVPGAVFAVKTNAGNYAKVKVQSYGYDLVIRWRTYKLRSPYKVLGTGYTQPEDVALSGDGLHAYVTERTGALLKVELDNANRSAATVVADGMTAPHQIALDEDHGYAFTVEFASPGQLIRVDLSTGDKTVLRDDLDNAIGLLVTSDLQFAYVSEQSSAGGRLLRINLQTGAREELVGGMASPFFLTWADPGENGIITTERDPANRVALIDLTQPTVTVTHLATGVASRPSSVAVAGPLKLLVCSDSQISELLLADSVFNPAGPLLLGFGHVPVTDLDGGYATTAPGYFFQVKDAPFGGKVSLMFNHEKARTLGATYYRVSVGGTAQSAAWVDYKWSSSAKKFVADTQTPTSTGLFKVRGANQLWYNHWLGFRLNTRGLSNGLHTVKIEIYATASAGSKIGEDLATLMIDNSKPRASINSILHRKADGTDEVVNVCGIVTKRTSEFSCDITAQDNEGHLKNWDLRVLWGNNKSMHIASDSYTPTATKKWYGVPGTVVPSTPKDLEVAGDITSIQCAHTFYLTVWDRVINGYNHIHRSSYHKSITLMIP